MAFYPKAFIYDLDGVITDTAEYHYLAWKQLAEELGVSFDRHFNEQLKGISRMDSLDRILALNPTLATMSEDEKKGHASRKNDYYLELIETISPADVLPGIEELLKMNQQHGLKIALGSASKNAAHVLEKLELTHYFDYIVDASKVMNGKPDPETFLAAAEALGLSPADCIGVEDSAAGIESINAAGMFSVGVGDAAHLHGADLLVDSTSLLDYDEIIKRYEEQRKASEE